MKLRLNHAPDPVLRYSSALNLTHKNSCRECKNVVFLQAKLLHIFQSSTGTRNEGSSPSGTHGPHPHCQDRKLFFFTFLNGEDGQIITTCHSGAQLHSFVWNWKTCSRRALMDVLVISYLRVFSGCNQMWNIALSAHKRTAAFPSDLLFKRTQLSAVWCFCKNYYVLCHKSTLFAFFFL